MPIRSSFPRRPRVALPHYTESAVPANEQRAQEPYCNQHQRPILVGAAVVCASGHRGHHHVAARAGPTLERGPGRQRDLVGEELPLEARRAEVGEGEKDPLVVLAEGLGALESDLGRATPGKQIALLFREAFIAVRLLASGVNGGGRGLRRGQSSGPHVCARLGPDAGRAGNAPATAMKRRPPSHTSFSRG